MIRTLIAEQNCLIRAGLVALLSCADDIEIIAELQRGDRVVSASRALRPDVALLAATLPGGDGFTAARALHAELPTCHSLIIASSATPPMSGGRWPRRPPASWCGTRRPIS